MTPHKVVVLALDGVIAFELGTPSRLLEFPASMGLPRLYEVVTASLCAGAPVRTSSDFQVLADRGPEALAEADTVIVPASNGLGPVTEEGLLTEELASALALVRPGTRMVSICTGAFVLAAAGLLDGRPATTHWRYAERFRRLFPRVRLDPDVLFVDDGDVLTSGGVAAGVDLCLHLLRRDHGSEIANTVARYCLVPPWRDGGQAQYIERPVPTGSAGASTSAGRAWALERLDQPVSLRELADRCGMSVRTFTRRFREETGLSPGEWLTRERARRARHLLETTDLTVERIAREVGFSTAAGLRARLRAELGVSPSTYRRTFATRGAPLDPRGDAKRAGAWGELRG